ncbi:MAG TPA: CoA ester lyase [Lysobacter sp.]|jgi:citrate lyase subunit beta/citryl-CoA lyase|nr:CoA ester lyase [Lysobacter sp.]
MRSKLFVPGGRPELFPKALAGAADALSFDLEDSVTAECKDEARRLVADYVRSDVLIDAAKVIIVRTNAPGTPWFEDDVRAVMQRGVTLINLPKVESAEDLDAAVAVIERAEAHNGLQRPIGLLINIETPKALANAAAIARAHPRVAGLQLGLADLFESRGIDRHDRDNVHAAMFAVRMAAAQADVFALDGAFADIEDDAGYSTEAGMAHRLGFIGKTCVHPRQVALANAAFAVSESELAAALRIVNAAQEAKDQGRGAFVVDGRMVDLPMLKRAQALIASSK